MAQVSPSVRFKPAYFIAVVALFLLLAAELWMSVKQLSQTADEGAHLYSGYQYWKSHDYGLNPEHPPLLKLVAALPLLRLPLHPAHPPPVESKVEEYLGGTEFLYKNDADQLLLRSRIAASSFTFLLAALVFAAGYEMFGALAGLAALLLCATEPNLLAHGALVTTDMAAACTIFAAVYALYRYQKRPTFARVLVVGLSLGLAATAKFSAVVLLPVFAICLVGEWARGRRNAQTAASRPAAEYPARLLGWAGAIALAYVVLWALYGFSYHARPAGAQLSPSLPVYAAQLTHRGEAHLLLWLARYHLLPESLIYGFVDTQVFGGQIPSFLLGKVYPGSTRLYFPIAFLIKNTLPVLLLLAALPWMLRGRVKQYGRELFFLVVPAVVYFAFSEFAPQNIGVRHILPIFPFVILLAALSAALLAQRSRAGAVIAGVLLMFHTLSSAAAFPDYIPYSNELFGGPSHTYRLINDSNADWGQGVKEVRSWLEKNRITDCWYVAFGGNVMSNPPYYHVPCRPLPAGFEALIGFPLQPVPVHIHGPILLSAFEASGVFWGPQPLNPYLNLLRRRPDAMIGGNTLVFNGDVDLPLASAETHGSAAHMLLQQGKLTEALTEAQTAVSLAPQSPDLQVVLGAVQLKAGKQAEAEQTFSNAKALAAAVDPHNMLHLEESLAAARR